ncbi:MAG: helix-turn-helix transcriptional regulator [Clostridia bacterium]|nr:helix-turn-helix transcriptional regulator [Clostridia bacterium]
MIVFNKLWETMKQKGGLTYMLRKKGGIESKTIHRLKANDIIETKTLDKIRVALDCKLEDIMEYTKE